MKSEDINSDEEIRAHILFKLVNRRMWGNKHTELIHVRSGLKKGQEKRAEEIAKKLRNEGFLTWLPKTGQIHISLNPGRRKEILEIVEKLREKQIW